MGTVTIEWLLPDGEGAGRTADGVVRVPGTIPGDVVQFREVRRQGRTIVAALESIDQPSSQRQAPACPWDAACGGCDLASFAPEPRHIALAAMAQRALDLEQPPPWVPSPRRIGHRARIRLALEGGRVGYHGARSHELVEIGT